ncbi:MAG: hypothetical protein H8E84_02905 [Flavobacteriales bacterium]|nr:hypothetical protein [Flavobacteriales bacterium]
MKKLLLILIASPMIGFGQFTDDFSDGDFTNNPSWLGDVAVFEVDTNFSLHLNDSVANASSLVTPSQAIINGEWIFSVRLDFSPSANNFAKVYLTSDMVDLSGPLNGMYVKIGGQSGSVDDVSLYTQTGTNSTEIIDGVAGLVSSNPDVSVKVTRDVFGNWELFLDTTGGFFTQGTAFDTSIISSEYFGVYCKYTITRSDKFWFDDFSVSGFTSSWDCDLVTGCYDSGTGQGTYSSLAACQSACIITPTWDCVSGNCQDPGTGNGQYSSLAACQAVCNITGINDNKNISKKVEKIIDVLGRETSFKKHTPLFYIYDDGTVEKRIIIK